MAYNELIKNFQHIRDYMRDFYVYGFKRRDEYQYKSGRSYDDERRRIDSWLGEYMGFRRQADGKQVFLAVDNRACAHNPLFKAWKTRSFTDGDITLHFILFDILHDSKTELSLREISERIDRDYLAQIPGARIFDESTLRKKLKEYVEEGLICAEKQGRQMMYRRNGEEVHLPSPALHFFSETAPCGVIGSFLLDKEKRPRDYFSFKHHYITHTMDSEVLYQLLTAIREGRYVTLENAGRRQGTYRVIPLRIRISVQGGRQYLMGYDVREGRIRAYRIDYIKKVQIEEPAARWGELRERLEGMEKYMWGVNCKKDRMALETVEFTVYMAEDEEHIYRRLEREKRCGTVERLDDHHARFYAEVYDCNEMLAWIRTFLCRIVDLRMSNKEIEKKFKDDLQLMYRLYGVGGGETP